MQLNEHMQKQITEIVLKASAPWVLEMRDTMKRDRMYNDINASLSRFRQEHPEIASIGAEILHPHHVNAFGLIKVEGGVIDTFSFRINLFDDSDEEIEDEMTEDERVETIFNELARHVPPDMYSCCNVGVIPCEDGSFIVTARFAPKGPS